MILLKKYLCFISGLVFISCSDPSIGVDSTIHFSLLKENETHISFSNTIKESDLFNHFYYSQIYSGAGVGIGDINNDGLNDLFFCGNQVKDRLYLNLGNFKFKDITRQAISELTLGWSTGVSMVDINGDGFLDIYICRGGNSMNPKDRKNVLLINDQNLKFKDSAENYGLADMGFSSQAVFFDADGDNDLDAYIVNQPPDPRAFIRYKISQSRKKYFKDRFFLNQDGIFKDFSSQYIDQKMDYGLGVVVSDFNNDGWRDLYICNDYDKSDLLYYNQYGKSFKNVALEKLKHISRFSMGVDAADINNDGWVDLATLDMAAQDHYRSKTNMRSMTSDQFHDVVDKGDHYQYMYNTLQINNGGEVFQDIGHMVGFATTDWSWASLIVDLDNDGLKDVIVTNGIKKDIRNNDILAIMKEKLAAGDRDYYTMSESYPSEPLGNIVFRNRNNYKFTNVSQQCGFEEASFSTGMAYGDLDNDGDFDLVINNIDKEAFVYRNESANNYVKIKLIGPKSNPLGYGARVTAHVGGINYIQDVEPVRGYFSSVEPNVIFGLGKNELIDSLSVIWTDFHKTILSQIVSNQSVVIDYNQSYRSSSGQLKRLVENPISPHLLEKIEPSTLGLDFRHEENDFDDFIREILLPYKLSQNGPFMAVGDVNGDSLDDLFIGGAAGQAGCLYIQDDKKQFNRSINQPWEDDELSEDMESVFVDVDGDADLDLFIASGGSDFESESILYQDRMYLNDGQGNFERDHDWLPLNNTSTQSTSVADIDGNGTLDFFIGGRLLPGHYPHPPSSQLLLNDGTTLREVANSRAPDLKSIGLVTDAVFTDFDMDGDPDLMIVGEWMNITMLENSHGKYKDITEKLGLSNTAGLWWSISTGDMDNDGDEDYIVGNLGLNHKFKPKESKPFRIYAGDFDDNGTNDIVLATSYKDHYVPVRGRECSSQQMPFISKKFDNYHSFASSQLSDIIPKNKLDSSISYAIDIFESIILINHIDYFEIRVLPVETQFSPIKSSLIVDINNDGHQDILTIGNHYPVEVETTRFDAGIGTLLLGDGAYKFNVLPFLESGFLEDGDSRDLINIDLKGEPMVIISNNNSTLSAYKLLTN